MLKKRTRAESSYCLIRRRGAGWGCCCVLDCCEDNDIPASSERLVAPFITFVDVDVAGCSFIASLLFILVVFIVVDATSIQTGGFGTPIQPGFMRNVIPLRAPMKCHFIEITLELS
jgi:hypothetical protein